MVRAITIVVTFISAGLFAWAVPLLCLFGAFQSLTVALSIMVAAVFVRLNRGMPSLEWKTLDPVERKQLTTAIVQVTTEYGWIIGVNAFSLAGLIGLSVVGAADVSVWPDLARRITSGAIGGFVALSAARMAYVVWRDIDIVRLQKRLIDGSADREENEREMTLAEGKVANIRSAGVRPVEVKPPRAWGD